MIGFILLIASSSPSPLARPGLSGPSWRLFLRIRRALDWHHRQSVSKGEADQQGRYSLGLDLRQNAAMSGASAFFPETELLDGFACFPELPSLAPGRRSADRRASGVGYPGAASRVSGKVGPPGGDHRGPAVRPLASGPRGLADGVGNLYQRAGSYFFPPGGVDSPGPGIQRRWYGR